MADEFPDAVPDCYVCGKPYWDGELCLFRRYVWGGGLTQVFFWGGGQPLKIGPNWGGVGPIYPSSRGCVPKALLEIGKQLR